MIDHLSDGLLGHSGFYPELKCGRSADHFCGAAGYDWGVAAAPRIFFRQDDAWFDRSTEIPFPCSGGPTGLGLSCGLSGLKKRHSRFPHFPALTGRAPSICKS